MKKILLALTTVLLAGFLFTSANPSLDGRALVADEGVFPHGYFAKTVGYLPGDSIKVTNPVNGERIDILVIGSLDASDGVAILLSPEAAQALSVKKNSNTLVKLTKRNGNADDVVSGNAVLAMGEDIPEPEYPEVAMPQPVDESIEEYDEEYPEEYAENIIMPEEKDLRVDYAMDIPEEEAEEEAELAKIDEGIPEEYAKEEVETPKPEYVIADDIPEDEEVVEVAKNNPIDEEYLVDEFPEEEYVAETLPEVPTEEELAAAQEFISNEDSEDEEYDAIVLVPSEVNPPESSGEVAEATPAPKGEVSSVADYSELDSGKYYVQIAVYNDIENIDEVNDLYGSRYPLVVLDKGTRKTVMVGPFNIDEYGTVLERFKAYGYTDAFVKKIN